MEKTTYLLIGGGLSAYKATKGIRSQDPEGDILMIASEAHTPYDRPPLSKAFMRGEKELEALFYESAADLADEGVAVRLGVSVTDLDPQARTARLTNGETVHFEKALLATGGSPIALQVPGADLERIYLLRTIEDAQRIREAAQGASRTVVVGAGFIGMELAASLTKIGLEVTVVEAQPRIWSRFVDETLSTYFQDYYTERGIQFRTSARVAAFHGGVAVNAVELASGERLSCDFVVVAIGIRPNTALAEAAGLRVDNGVLVDERLETSASGIFAAGDIAHYIDPIFGRRRRVEHWGQADYTGELAGKNMAGASEAYDMVTYAWSDIFDLHLEFVGDETDYDEVLLRGEPTSHSFTALYLKENRLRAFFAINTDTDFFTPLERLIRSGFDLSQHKATLTDPDSDLSMLG